MIPGFNPIDLDLLRLAKAAYGPCTYDSEWAHLLIEETDEWLLWAFRGTVINNPHDLLIDGALFKTFVSGFGVVHQGFNQSCTSLLWRLIPLVIAAKAKGKKIAGTGHSKAGSEARQAAGMLKAIGLCPDRLVVWEPARSLSTEALATVATIPGYGVRNGPDPVPCLPPWWEDEKLIQLGKDILTLDALKYHDLVNVESAFMAAVVATP